MEGVVDGVGGGVEEIWRGIVRVFKSYMAEVYIRTFSDAVGCTAKQGHYRRLVISYETKNCASEIQQLPD